MSYARSLAARIRAISAMRLVAVALGVVLVLAGVAFAVVPSGLQNGSFEQDLSGWDATTVRGGVYSTAPVEPASCTVPNGVCVVGTDHFTVRDDVYKPDRNITVAPLDGTKMVRLGGPFHDADETQPIEQYRLEQTFTVDPAHPILALNYNVFTWDYKGFDDLFFRVTLTDENGATITNERQGSFGVGVSLKTTGWRPTHIDLSGYEGQQVHLKIVSGGTADMLFGFWSYIDAGMVAAPPVGTPKPAPVMYPPSAGGGEVPIDSFDDGNTGQTWLAIPASAPSKFPSNCMPLTFDVPISAGGGTVSNANLILDPKSGAAASSPLADPNNDGIWTGTISCVKSGELFVSYDLTENGNTQSFSVPLGGLVLIDPAGIVYDKQAFDAAKAAGHTDAEARAAAAIPGAQVRLQRCTTDSGGCTNVLSGDPGIAPHVNPEVTGSDGQFQWDVSAGHYRVVVTKAGYDTATGSILAVPPAVTDAHVAMTKTPSPSPPPTHGDPPPTHSDTPPDIQNPEVTPVTPKPACSDVSGKQRTQCMQNEQLKKDLAACDKLVGKKKAACRSKVLALASCNKLGGAKRNACRKRVLALATCDKLSGKKRTACRKRVLALAKCDKLKGKKKAACRKRVRSPGKKH